MSGFESQFTRHFAQIAQSVEQGTENPCVRGSIPRLGTIKKYLICLGGEIGRRTGLKILWKQFRAGSSPARGTTKEKKICGSSSVGRASAFQAECREVVPRLPPQIETP